MNALKWMIIVLLTVSVVFMGCTRSASDSSDSIKVGVILPLTGSGSDQAEAQRQGLEVAVDEINSARVNESKIELLFEDSKGGKANEAIAAYQKMRSLYSIPMVITWGSGVGIALNPLVNRDKVIQMGIATASPDYSTPNDFSFRVFPSSTAEGAFGARLLWERLRIAKAAVLYEQNDYGEGSQKAFSSEFKKLSGSIVATESVPIDATDARAQLQKIKEKEPVAVYLAVYPKEGGILLKQAKEIGLNARFVASTAILSENELFGIAGNAAEGLLVTTAQFDANNPDLIVQQFVQGFRLRFKEEPATHAAIAYDGLKVLAEALKKCPNANDTECIKNALFSMKDYQGASGKINFDSNGDSIKEFQVLEAKNKRFVPYKTE